MKNYLSCIALCLLISIGYGQTKRFRSNDSIAVSNDSTVYKIVKKLAQLTEKRNEIAASENGLAKNAPSPAPQAAKTKNIDSHSRPSLIRDSFPMIKNISTVIISEGWRLVAIDSLIGMDVNKVDSIRIILDKSTFARAVYGSRSDLGIIQLFINSPLNEQLRYPSSVQPEELRKRIEVANEPDSSLLNFVRDIYYATEMNVVDSKEAVNALTSGSSQVSINDRKAVAINTLLNYRIDDLVYMTIKLPNRKRKESKVNIHLRTYSDLADR